MSREIPVEERITWGEYQAMMAAVAAQEEFPMLRGAREEIADWQDRQAALGRVTGALEIRVVFKTEGAYPPYTRVEFEGMQAAIEGELAA